MLHKKSTAAPDAVIGEMDYLIENRFTVTGIIVSYTIDFGVEQGLVSEFPNLLAYLERLFRREHCTLVHL